MKKVADNLDVQDKCKNSINQVFVVHANSEIAFGKKNQIKLTLDKHDEWCHGKNCSMISKLVI